MYAGLCVVFFPFYLSLRYCVQYYKAIVNCQAVLLISRDTAG